MRIYLIGMMGSGKTTIGQKLSTYLMSEFIDIDAQIERQSQMSITQIFKQYGEEYFRQLETDTLISTNNQNPVVIATGGGVVVTSENCDFLQNEHVFFLHGSSDLLWSRVVGNESRPLVTTEQEFKERYEQRLPMYETVAKYKIDIENKTIKDIIAEILFIISKIEGV